MLNRVINRNEQMSSFNECFVFLYKPYFVSVFRYQVLKNFYAPGTHSSLIDNTILVFIWEEQWVDFCLYINRNSLPYEKLY